jgi:hypothetical protein
MFLKRWLIFLLSGVLAVGTIMPGCSTAETGFIEREIYPANTRQTKSLDIQVFRDSTTIRFTNSTAVSIPACTMWINAWYSTDFKGLAVGESIEMNLYDFNDQYGDTFRAGGFFATERPTKLVFAQLEVGDELLGLVVVNEYE